MHYNVPLENMKILIPLQKEREREIEKGNLRNFTHHQDATTINARVVCGQNLVILAPFLPAKTMK